MDRISIVVAVYNAEKYLCKCIDSLLSQTYENTEIILVNDCSKDSSLTICREYSAKFNNIKTITNKVNLGVSVTRNNGIEASTGEYICFVDSDDYVEPDYLEKLYNYYLEYNTVPICGFIYHDEYNRCKPIEYKWSGGNELVSLGEAFRLNDELYLTALWNKLFDLKLIKSKNIRFDTSVTRGEDLRFSVDYFRTNKIDSVFAFSSPLYHYNKLTNDSLMSKIDEDIIKKSFENLELVKDLAVIYNDNNNEIYLKKVEELKQYYIYLLVRSKKYSNKEKYNLIVLFCPGFSKKDFIKARILIYKEKIHKLLRR